MIPALLAPPRGLALPAPSIPLIGFDIAAAPDPAAAAALIAALGASWCVVYIGGPEMAPAAHPWAAEPLRALPLPAGFLPTYVGRQTGDDFSRGAQDGAAAVQLAEAFGFRPGGPIMLDVESGTFDSNPWAVQQYVADWLYTVRRLGWIPGPYSSGACLAFCAAQIAAAGALQWLAAWRWVGQLGPAPDLTGCDVRQFAGDVPAAGLTVDVNLARAGFPFARL